MRTNKVPFKIGGDEQRNIAPLDVARNVGRFDAALWQGARSFSTVQRVGVAVFGIFFLVGGWFFLNLVLEIIHEDAGHRASLVVVYAILTLAAMGILCLIFGFRLIYNLFRTQRTATDGHRRHR
jgi:hypothetical protein